MMKIVNRFLKIFLRETQNIFGKSAKYFPVSGLGPTTVCVGCCQTGVLRIISRNSRRSLPRSRRSVSAALGAGAVGARAEIQESRLPRSGRGDCGQ